MSRRQLLGAPLALAIGALLNARDPADLPAAGGPNHHLVWVWQFSEDGEPELIRAQLRKHGLGVILKSHDGVTWMSAYDSSPRAINGPSQAARMAEFFESQGVPFHAWCVLHGSDPVREANMAAAVLDAGARSLWLDLEPHPGFWRGSPEAAVAYGTELRRLQPDAELVLSIDPRPWLLQPTPIREFAAFSNRIAPQQYWPIFNTRSNYARFQDAGFPVPDGGVTPEFLLGVSQSLLPGFGLPIHQTGQPSPQAAQWRGFVNGAMASGSDFVSTWRFGITPDFVFSLLADIPPRQPPAPGVHEVRKGETLWSIATAYGVSVESIAAANGLQDPNFIREGRQLVIPVPTLNRGTGVRGAVPTYSVEPGDTLSILAARFGTSVDALARANGLPDPNMVVAGTPLIVP